MRICNKSGIETRSTREPPSMTKEMGSTSQWDLSPVVRCSQHLVIPVGRYVRGEEKRKVQRTANIPTTTTDQRKYVLPRKNYSLGTMKKENVLDDDDGEFQLHPCQTWLQLNTSRSGKIQSKSYISGVGEETTASIGFNTEDVEPVRWRGITLMPTLLGRTVMRHP